MAIKGVTDRGASFPQIGVLRKGSPKIAGKYGKELDHFRFDTNQQDALEAFQAAYGDTPRRVDIYLPFNTVEENFQTCKEAWTASALQHRCDGETCSRWLGDDGKYHDDPRPCPGGCKEVGRLKVIIPALRRLAYVVAETHSIHDIVNLSEQLTALEMLRGSLRGIPLILSRYAKMISTPRPDGKRARVEKWLMSVEAAPTWVDLQLAEQERQALPNVAALALPAPNRETVDYETGEIIQQARPQPKQAADRADRLRTALQELLDVAHKVGITFDEYDITMMDAQQLTDLGKAVRANLVARIEDMAEDAIDYDLPSGWQQFKAAQLDVLVNDLIAAIAHANEIVEGEIVQGEAL